MAEKTAVLTDKAPKPLAGIYSQAIKANGFVFVSGAVPMDPETMKIVNGDIQAHTVSWKTSLVYRPRPADRYLFWRQHQCIKNLAAILEASGSDITKVVKVNVFLSNMDDFAAMNEIYSQYWGEVKPCRTCVAVKTLPLNVDVEIECTATY
ncbi:L-PSP endoribonuclease family protein Brt1 [Hypoxylon sp. FL0543]|nr:L-PSP endoribonuclease family protein Brt1 [Hypoxylon sp. FL0543]